MFFGRNVVIGLKSSDTKEAMYSNSSNERRRRGLAALSLAVAMAAAPLGVGEFAAQVRAEAPVTVDAAVIEQPLMVQEQGNVSSAEMLKSAVEDYKAGKYEEAQATIGQIKASDLNAANQKTLESLTERVNKAADQRKGARSEFEAGQAALESKDSSEALKHFTAAASNKYADQGTRQKAMEQMALAESAEKQAAGDRKLMYEQAVSDYKAGNYDSAKGKFEQLKSAGFSAPLFHKSPDGYLKDINKKQGNTVAAETAESTKPEATAVAAAAPADEGKAAAAQQDAAAQAKSDAAAAPAEKADKSAADAEAKAAAAAEKEGDSSRKAEGKRLYQLAKEQYKSGDWIAARANFVAAQDLGYKAGLFEDSPAKILARMDKKEQADAAKSAQAGADQSKKESDTKELTAAAPAAPAVERAKEVVATPAAPGAPAAPAAAPATPVAPAAQAVAESKSQQDLEATAQLEKIRQQQKAYEAQQLVEQARTAQQEQRFADALNLYSKAGDLDPNNQQASAGRTEMQNLTGRAPQQSTLLGRQQSSIETRRQAVTYSFNTAVDDTNTAIDSSDFKTARTRLAAARVAAESDPTIFSADQLREFNSKVASTASRLDSAEAQASETARKRESDEAARAQQLKVADEKGLREQTVANLIKAARRSIEENKYREAVGLLDQVLVIDPNNEYASGVKPLVEDKANLMEQRTYRDDYRRQLTKQLNAADEKMVPYDDIFRYPVNWPDISTTRDASVEKERGGTQEDTIVRAQLERRLPEVRFDAIPFSDVIDFLRDTTGANIFVNWRALETAGVDRNAPVTTRLRDVKFSKALETILKDVGGGTVQVTYTIDDGVITISTSEELSKNVITRVYDIRDLIVDVPDFRGPEFDLQSISQQSGQSAQSAGSGGGGGGSSQGLFGGSGSSQNQQGNQKTREDRVNEITSLISETVSPDSWRESGGTVGSLKELSGQLIVTQTPENQRQLQSLLEQLRETRAIQITIETRFLTVTRNYLEDIGFDLDFVFNNQNALQTFNPYTNPAYPTNNGNTTFDQVVNRIPGTGRFSPIVVNQGSSAYTQGVQTSAPGSINANSTVPPVGLSTSGTFLDDFQVNFLLRATEVTRQSTLLTAPRVTLFNGQNAYVVVSTNTAYVSNLTPIAGTTSLQPTLNTVPSGVVLQVQATVSADRKYVTLTLQPSLQTLDALVNFTFQSTPPVNVGGNGSVVIAPTATIQIPTTTLTQVKTTVSVPDGGTLLLGGQTIAGETELEAGVPVLSKIPFLKRLFTNRSMAKDEQVLLILVKPTIIIQRELEEKQFPMLSQKVGG